MAPWPLFLYFTSFKCTKKGTKLIRVTERKSLF